MRAYGKYISDKVKQKREKSICLTISVIAENQRQSNVPGSVLSL